jgi:hypothetical protein
MNVLGGARRLKTPHTSSVTSALHHHFLPHLARHRAPGTSSAARAVKNAKHVICDVSITSSFYRTWHVIVRCFFYRFRRT